MFGTLVTLVLVAGPPQLATTPWNLSDVSPELALVLDDSLAAALRSHGLKVVTRQEIAVILGQERQRQLLGCNDSSQSCLAELANALGCGATVVVSLARLGSDFRGTARVLSANDGAVLAEAPLRASSQTALADSLDEVAATLARALEPATPAGRLWWVPAVGGVVLAGFSAACFWQAGLQYQAYLGGSASAAGPGKAWQGVAWTAAGLGVAAVVGSLLWWRLGAPVTVTPSVSVGSASVSIAGVW